MSTDPETFSLLLETVRKFVNERLIPAEAETAGNDRVDPALADEMRNLGLFGLSIPPEFGGIGLGMEEEILVAIELGQTSPAFRSVFGTNVGIGSQAIIISGTDYQQEHYLPRMAAGDLIGSFALTEPDAGSDAMSLRTRAEKTDGGYILNGTKRYITNAPQAGLFTVMARTAEEKRAGSISCFLVEADTPGLTLGTPERKMGQQGAHVCDVNFNDCRVPDTALLGNEEGIGFTTAMKVLDRGRLHISAVCVGMAERLIRESVTFAKSRVQFGKPIADFQLIQAMIADSQAECYAARSMVLDAARRRAAGENITMEASCCKLFASEMVGRVADRAVQIHGGAGYMCEYAVERFYRDVRLFRLYEGTSQIQQLVIAREVLKRD